MPRASTFEALADLAEDQWGLFTRRQAEATGMAWTTLSRLARDGAVERVAHGVYRLRGTPVDEQLAVCAAWLQLAPDVRVWERTSEQGVVSRRSAAAIYGLGHLPADIHQFTLPVRRQTRRDDVRLYTANVGEGDWARLRGLLVTRPARIASDLLAEREDPEAVAHVIADALRAGVEQPDIVARGLASHAKTFGLGRGAGLALLDWLLDLTGDPQRGAWLTLARQALAREHGNAVGDR